MCLECIIQGNLQHGILHAQEVLPYQDVGGLAQNLPLKFMSAPKFCLKNIGDKYPKFFPLNFRFSQILSQDLLVSCDNRTSQVFPLIWLTWLDFAPNFASKLDVRSNA